MANRQYFNVSVSGIGDRGLGSEMKRHGAGESRRDRQGMAEDGKGLAGPTAILDSVAIVSDKRFRLDVELRHPR